MIHSLNSLNIHPYLTWIHGGVTMLLVETNQGLVLVDTGVGRQDIKHPSQRMRLYKWFYRAPGDLAQTAIQQVQELGYKPEDVQHIILSHAHLDHAGGLADFQWAKVHVLQKELDTIKNKPNWKYLPQQWAHQPNWEPHTTQSAKRFGFDAAQLEGFSPRIWMLPLPGHTPGLSGVVIQTESGWLLYGSDALPYNARVDLVPRWFARFFMYHHAPKIRRLIKEHPEIQIISGHMPKAFYKKTPKSIKN